MDGERPLDPSRAAAAEAFLESLAELGLDRLPRAVHQPAEAPESTESEVAEPGPRLEQLNARIEACRLCALGETRRCSVPGEGSARARVMFVGEAPGAQEDASGRPFVGPAGQLLTKIIENGMGLSREEVFIANVLKCRPPQNRDPQTEEKKLCTPFLQEQMEIIAPELVIALGKHAANHLLGRESSLGRLRGRLHQPAQGGPPVLATYHPAYLLRNPADKRACWQDIQMGMDHLGLKRPSRASGGQTGTPTPAPPSQENGRPQEGKHRW
ncbi:MAG: uracil-DNA glycosylase [Planctomycetota bacterium]|nr:MAG: uracil-DNA glycosylase [Planctomycetota bacterium]